MCLRPDHPRPSSSSGEFCQRAGRSRPAAEAQSGTFGALPTSDGKRSVLRFPRPMLQPCSQAWGQRGSILAMAPSGPALISRSVSRCHTFLAVTRRAAEMEEASKLYARRLVGPGDARLSVFKHPRRPPKPRRPEDALSGRVRASVAKEAYAALGKRDAWLPFRKAERLPSLAIACVGLDACRSQPAGVAERFRPAGSDVGRRAVGADLYRPRTRPACTLWRAMYQLDKCCTLEVSAARCLLAWCTPSFTCSRRLPIVGHRTSQRVGYRLHPGSQMQIGMPHRWNG